MAQSVAGDRGTVRPFLVFVVALVSVTGSAQGTKDLDRRIEAVQRDLAVHGTLRPFDNTRGIGDSILTLQGRIRVVGAYRCADGNCVLAEP